MNASPEPLSRDLDRGLKTGHREIRIDDPLQQPSK